MSDKPPIPSLSLLQRKAKRSSLASISEGLNRILSITMDASSGINDLTQLIEQDPSLTTNILRRANSAAYGMRRQISNIQQAAVLLGFNTIQEIALQFSASRFFRNSKEIGPYLRKRLWHHSLAVALFSKALPEKSQVGRMK
jgi:HD-like signal output (HDOD) protein